VKYCPLLDTKKIVNLIKKLPQTINPKLDSKWAFIDKDHDTWMFHNGNWIDKYMLSNMASIASASDMGLTKENVPEEFWDLLEDDQHSFSYSTLIGVKKLTNNERNQILTDYLKNNKEFSKPRTNDTGFKLGDNGGQKEKKSGCFIATTVYGSENSWQVVELKKFRDTHLSKFYLGRVLIYLYYLISPIIASTLEKSGNSKKIFRMLLDKLLKEIVRINKLKPDVKSLKSIHQAKTIFRNSKVVATNKKKY